MPQKNKSGNTQNIAISQLATKRTRGPATPDPLHDYSVSDIESVNRAPTSQGSWIVPHPVARDALERHRTFAHALGSAIYPAAAYDLHH